VSCRPDLPLPVEVLSCLFGGLFLAKLVAAHRAGRLKFFGVHARLRTFKAYLAPLRKIEWGGLCEEAVRRAAGCAGLSFALNHRVAISNLVPIQPRS
jgi:hypothetical protein